MADTKFMLAYSTLLMPPPAALCVVPVASLARLLLLAWAANPVELVEGTEYAVPEKVCAMLFCSRTLSNLQPGQPTSSANTPSLLS